MDKKESRVVIISGQKRRVYRVKCSHCGKIIWKRKFQIKTFKTLFCSQKCMKEYRKKGCIVMCANCGKKIYKKSSQLKRSKSQRSFCCRSCATSFNNAIYKSGENHPLWNGGKSSYRKKALKYYGHQCMNSKCPIMQSKIPIPTWMLDVNHIDGNRSNNKMSNLEVLCLWCHGIKTRKK